MDDDVMSAEEAQAWRDDGVDGNRDEIARLCDTIIALHQRAAGAWLAGAQAAREADVARLRSAPLTLGTRGCAEAVEELPLPTPPAPPQSPLPSPDGGTGPQGDGAPAGGCGVAEAYVEAAVVCERMAQAHDRLAAVADSEGAERRQREAAGVLRCAADRIRALAGGP